VFLIGATGLLGEDPFSVIGKVSLGVVCAVIGGDLTVSQTTRKVIEEHDEKKGKGGEYINKP
jgi:hypothetical protein